VSTLLKIPLQERLSPYRVLANGELEALSAWASTFYEFQIDWLFEDADYAISNKARQIGLSHTSGALGVLWGAFHGETTTILSKGERESREVLDKARLHAQVLQSLGSRMALLKRDSAEEIKFASGGRVLALPSSGGRGFTGNVVLDEFAYHETDDEKVWDAALAVTMLGGRGRVISTPNGVSNKFAEVWRHSADKEFGWKRHETSIWKAQEQGYPVDIAKCWKLAAGNKILFSQLFECQFVDADSRFLFHQVRPDENRYDVLPGWFEQVFIGLDFASSTRTSADYSAAVVLGRLSGITYVIDVLRLHVDPREFRDRIPELIARFPSAMCSTDVAAPELGGVEFFRESGIPIIARQASVGKFERAIFIAAEWNVGNVLLPRSAPWLDAFLAELTSFTGTKKDRHDDMVDALASAFNGMRVAPIDWDELAQAQAQLPKAVSW
jgi:predicted phage terminase large subunit-like protein